MRRTSELKVVIVGAGPAGLTAASELCDADISNIVLEKDDIVGGISRTVSYKGYLFDIGGHRFFTKVKVVEEMWHRYMQDDFLLRNRISRILYNKKFFNYPLKISNALSGLGIKTSILILLSYLRVRISPIKDEKSFEDFVSNLFGRRLYNIFFKTYTEKVWGIPCNEISAEWAAQRIKGLSLVSAVKNAIIGNRFKTKQTVIKTLIDSFHYPRLGPGMMWEKVASDVSQRSTDIKMQTDVVGLMWDEKGITAVKTLDQDNRLSSESGTHFISTMPIRELVQKLNPKPPAEILSAGETLNYRDFLTVALVIDQTDLFEDNWIYIHDQSVKVGRIQNFKNWSPQMVPDQNTTCLGLEYFCFEGDGLWNMSDKDLLELGSSEMESLGFFAASEVLDGTVVRMPKAYPVYDGSYAEALATVREFVETKLPNLQLVGRNGMHKYNNQDHSMLTAMLAVENIRGAKNDLWSVNVEREYHEEISSEEFEREVQKNKLESTQPRVPTRLNDDDSLQSQEIADVTTHVFGRLDKLSLAIAFGALLSFYVFLGTLILHITNNTTLSDYAVLLDNYFYGYTVSIAGSVIGAIYGFIWGFLLGWLTAYFRNLIFGIYMHSMMRQQYRVSHGKLLDYL